MPQTLTVREVRAELFRAARADAAPASGPASPPTPPPPAPPPPAPAGAPSNLLLGTWFHEVFAGLVGGAAGRDAAGVLAGIDADRWEAELTRHAYDRLVGPRIGTRRPLLAADTRAFLDFWRAVEALCRWWIGLRRAAPRGAAPMELLPEQELSWELREPGWSDAVLVRGQADAVCRVPGRSEWCVIELKLGRGSAGADLGQACLYHHMLAASPAPRDGAGALALVSFGPAERTLLFTSDKVQPVRTSLVALIGRMAGVLPPTTAPAPSPSPAAPPCATAPAFSPSAAPLAASPSYDELARRLLRVFEEYKAPVRLAGPPIVGPTYLRFPVDPQKGVRGAQVQRVAPELGVRLKLAAPPFVHVSRGGLVVDLERPDRRPVPFADIRPQLPPRDPLLGSARVPLGVDLDGTLQFADLDRTEHCHILVAGTTGSGKSEWLRSALAGLLLGNTPETLRLVLIDPKRNAFAELRSSPYLLDPTALVYPDERDVTEVLDGLIEEMEGRYRELESAHADTLAELVRRRGRPRPRIVCVCDEYADLIARSRDERRAVEARIQRLGAKARASGIHLIIATQQPSREVLKGALDANLPARVGLRMAKDLESRMLLGEPGAERLLGCGDLLFKEIGDPRRLQAPFLDAAERAEIFATGR